MPRLIELTIALAALSVILLTCLVVAITEVRVSRVEMGALQGTVVSQSKQLQEKMDILEIRAFNADMENVSCQVDPVKPQSVITKDSGPETVRVVTSQKQLRTP